MKLISAIVLMIFSFSSFASFNEVECRGEFEGKSILLEVEQPFPNGTYFKRAQLTVTHEGANEVHNYTVSSRISRGGFNEVRYLGADLSLTVDFWPDQRPRWGRSYKGELRTGALRNEYIRGLMCRFPNVN